MSGPTITVNDVSSSTRILDITQTVEDKDGIPVSEQRLVYQGKELNKSQPASKYSIESESTLHSLLRMRGGLGERAVMDYTIGKEILRSPALPDLPHRGLPALRHGRPGRHRR